MSTTKTQQQPMFLRGVEENPKPSVYRDLIEKAKTSGGDYWQIWHLLAFDPEAAHHLAALSHTLMHKEAPISAGLRELIAAYTSSLNDCEFCMKAHAAVASILLEDEELVWSVLRDLETSSLENKRRELLRFVRQITLAPASITAADTQKLNAAGWDDAAIFYTTDGWTPTEASTRYAGPIPVRTDTRLQAIAIAPGKLPSAIGEATYTVNGPAAMKAARVEAANGVLLKGTALRLITGEDVGSDTAKVGDRIRLLLDENVVVGDTIVAARGTAVDGTITRVDRAGTGGKPGVIAFEVQVLNAHGIAVPLSATLTLAARDPRAQEQKVGNVSLVHVAGSLPAGDEAEIEPGMTLTASVGADTALRP